MTRVARAAALSAALVLALSTVASGATQTVRPPRSGSVYHGAAHHVDLQISGRSIAIIAFSFRCDGTKGRISLNDLRLKRSRLGYGFYAVVHGNVTFSDGKPDENGEVHIRGRFTPNAKSVRGRFRVVSPRCGNTGRLRWSATRV
jgi:hypothetical protein